MSRGTGVVPYRFRTDHQDLLNRPDPVEATRGIVCVPATRSVGCLVSAARLARDLGWPLVVVCSRHVHAAALRRAADRHGLPGPMTAVNLPLNGTLRAHRPWRTPEHRAARERHDIDTHRKRNAALAAARLVGAPWVLFVDDDVRGLAGPDVTAALGAAAEFAAHAWMVTRFPDNSVVCHARRDFGGVEQSVFASGASLLVRVDDQEPNFFPPVYNEDWLFLYDLLERRAVNAGHKVVRQLRYDPYVRPQRARLEEFGDVLAEGLFHLLHERQPVATATDPHYWHTVRMERRQVLDDITANLRDHTLTPHVDPPTRQDALHAMAESRSQLTRTTPELLADYVRRWRDDLETWREWFPKLPQRDTLDEAFGYLGYPPGSVVSLRA